MSGETAELFQAAEREEISIGHLDPAQAATEAIDAVMESGKQPIIMVSGGKDSATVANLTLATAVHRLKLAKHVPMIHVVNADTVIESPYVRALADSELAKMEAFGREHGFEVCIHITRPSLSASWAVRVLGGRALPSFPNNAGGGCAIDYKVMPNTKKVKAIQRAAAGRTVTFIGTRSGESTKRSVTTRDRRETSHMTWRGESGDEFLSPILEWSDDMVWTYLGEAAAGLHPAYSDFSDLMSFYADASASTCVVVADARVAATSKPCGARSGCWACTKVGPSDKSVENLLEANPDKYPYLVPLLQLRNYIAATQWDLTLRNHVGRTIDQDGYITIRPDQYSPDMCERLLRYTLSAQDDANALGAPSWVQPVGVREIVAIDFWWSARAMAPPWTALSIWLEHRAGRQLRAPAFTPTTPPQPVQALGRIHVGRTWDDNRHPMRPEGLRHVVWEIFSDSCGPGLRTGTSGQVFLALEEEPEFDVDEEGAYLFLEFEAQRKIKQYEGFTGDWTAAALEYLAYGCVSLAKGQSSAVDNMLRRAQWLQKYQLHGQRSPEYLLSRCVPALNTQVALF